MGDTPGFVVFKEQVDGYSGNKELYVWVACAPGKDNLDDYYEDYMYIASSIGASSVTWSSPRKAFQRLAKKNHWNIKTIIYEMKVK